MTSKIKCKVEIEYTYPDQDPKDPPIHEGHNMLHEVAKFTFLQNLKQLIEKYHEDRIDDWIIIEEVP